MVSWTLPWLGRPRDQEHDPSIMACEDKIGWTVFWAAATAASKIRPRFAIKPVSNSSRIKASTSGTPVLDDDKQIQHKGRMRRGGEAALSGDTKQHPMPKAMIMKSRHSTANALVLNSTPYLRLPATPWRVMTCAHWKTIGRRWLLPSFHLCSTSAFRFHGLQRFAGPEGKNTIRPKWAPQTWVMWCDVMCSFCLCSVGQRCCLWPFLLWSSLFLVLLFLS